MNPRASLLLLLMLIAILHYDSKASGRSNRSQPVKAWASFARSFSRSHRHLRELPEDCGDFLGGRRSVVSRISGGFKAEQGQFPSYVLLILARQDSYIFCGGTIISSWHILTAGHCVGGDTAEAFVSTSIKRVNPGSGIKSEKLCQSKRYESVDTKVRYDLGIIKLAEPIEFNDYIQPACLPLGHRVNPETHAWAVGMGKYGRSVEENFSDQLMVLPVKETICDVSDEHISTICFESWTTENVGDTCEGDSGGGILTIDEGRMYLVGVTSYGSSDCESGRKGTSVNANVFNLLGEIDALLRECA